MKNSLILFALSLGLLVGCKTTTSINADTYQKLTSEDSFEDFLNKKVQFEARICKMEMEHMLVLSMEGKRTYLCLDRLSNKGTEMEQLLAYTSDEAVLNTKYKDNELNVFGTIKVISGAGKGGGTHTEYYLELDNVILK